MMPRRLQEYVDGWKRLCPDYEIILWDEGNYDVSKNAYIGFERLSTVNTGSGFGARAGFPILKEIMDFYSRLEFRDEADPGKMILCPAYETAILQKHGLKLDGNFQIIDGMSVYPVMYFNAKSLYSNRMRITEETISVHHCTWTWAGEKNKL